MFEFAGVWTEPLLSAFLLAVEQIAAAVLVDLPDVAIPTADGSSLAVDDLLIGAELPAMDGLGGFLGQERLTLLRADGLLPITARMGFDAAEPGSLDARGSMRPTPEGSRAGRSTRSVPPRAAEPPRAASGTAGAAE